MDINSEQKILVKIQNELNYLMVEKNLIHLPKIISLLEEYCLINNLSKKDIKKLAKYSILF